MVPEAVATIIFFRTFMILVKTWSFRKDLMTSIINYRPQSVEVENFDIARLKHALLMQVSGSAVADGKTSFVVYILKAREFVMLYTLKSNSL